ncbi:MAG: 2-amino-4-hydroxy-6-hydroxymethyldihydropteridine diphosphokinase [Planctomycetota bacterium]|nr:MAG: 2-amino-4-hydroxy-6-hydroxymethyldihydropteridine diphosphokinase [Planctomycetota bacterium]
MEIAWVGFGSNIGDRLLWIEKALDMLHQPPENQVLLVSRVMETKPLEYTSQRNFYNGVCKVATQLDCLTFFQRLQDIEKALGREKKIPKGPRNIDLDLLFFGNQRVSLPHLQVPHKELANRYFVLKPLYELCPEWVHPIYQKTIAELWKEFLFYSPLNGEGMEIPRDETK